MSIWAALRTRRAIALPVLFLVALTVLFSDSRSSLVTNGGWEHLSNQILPPDDTTTIFSATRLEEYTRGDPVDAYCAARFSDKYLEDIRDHAASYCIDESTSHLTCFHSHTRSNGQVDSMCIGQGVDFDPATGRFAMDCPLRELSPEEIQQGLVPLDKFKEYWYETGPLQVFRSAVDFIGSTLTTPNIESRAEPSHGADATTNDDSEATSPEGASVKSPSTYILLKREGEGNLWHCLMEIFSCYLTIDVLRMSQNPLYKGKPFFDAVNEILDTQVIILDDRTDGPYFDLWTLFARRKPVRLSEFASDNTRAEEVNDAKIIIPLAGSSNPLWQDDSEVQHCNIAPSLSVFSRRVLDFYDVSDPPSRTSSDPIVLTFIDRQSRSLHNQTALFAELADRYPTISIQLVDFATISLKEQLDIIQRTDILAGVHGAGLAHTMFMRRSAGAVVELQPNELDHFGFRNLAVMRDISYFRAHTETVSTDAPNRRSVEGALDGAAELSRRDWHWEDIHITPERFFEVMDTAIKATFTKSPWNLDTIALTNNK